MSWPEARPNEVIFGLAEGKVKIGQLKSNKPATLYNVNTFCAALATSPDGNGVVSAHADGTLYRFLFDDNGAFVVVFGSVFFVDRGGERRAFVFVMFRFSCVVLCFVVICCDLL